MLLDLPVTDLLNHCHYVALDHVRGASCMRHADGSVGMTWRDGPSARDVRQMVGPDVLLVRIVSTINPDDREHYADVFEMHRGVDAIDEPEQFADFCAAAQVERHVIHEWLSQL